MTAKLVADGLLDPAAETVMINTGEGLKTLDAVAGLVGPRGYAAAALRRVHRVLGGDA